MKPFYMLVGGVVIAVVLTVLFVPEVAAYIEGQVFTWLLRLSR